MVRSKPASEYLQREKPWIVLWGYDGGGETSPPRLPRGPGVTDACDVQARPPLAVVCHRSARPTSSSEKSPFTVEHAVLDDPTGQAASVLVRKARAAGKGVPAPRAPAAPSSESAASTAVSEQAPGSDRDLTRNAVTGRGLAPRWAASMADTPPPWRRYGTTWPTCPVEGGDRPAVFDGRRHVVPVVERLGWRSSPRRESAAV